MLPAHARKTLIDTLLVPPAAADVSPHETAELPAGQVTVIAPGRPAAKPSKVGLVLRDTYQLVEQIGAGATGRVYRGQNLVLGIPVAVKLFAVTGDEPAVQVAQRARSEAVTLARLNHPNVVRLWDYGVSGRTPYLVTEYVAGRTLGAALKDVGRLPWKPALGVARQVADALRAADREGILHRDVKPDNILLAPDGTAKLVDFGLAVVRGGRSLYRTPSSRRAALAGTGAYMAPEQAREDAGLDRRADLYSLGATLFHAVVGRPPFEAAGLGQMLLRHLNDPAPAAHLLTPGMSLAASGLIARLLAKDPAARFADYDDLIRAIDQLLAA
jgi:serine/threonine protein kinase